MKLFTKRDESQAKNPWLKCKCNALSPGVAVLRAIIPMFDYIFPAAVAQNAMLERLLIENLKSRRLNNYGE